MEVTASLEALDAAPGGLSAHEAAERLVRAGANIVEVEPHSHPVRLFLRQFHNVLLYVLLGAATLTAALGQWVDTGVILGVVLINALVGFVQEGRAERAVLAIRSMLTLRATVLRGDHPTEIDAADLVPGDVILLQAGDRVPADVRLMETRSLETDQSLLTGESTPTGKRPSVLTGAVSLAERSNLAFAGTLITRGWGKALVVATGAATEVGKISGALRAARPISTPLLRKIATFARRLSLVILLLAGAVALFGGFVRDYALAEMLIAAVSIAVAAIPEGLPPVVTVTLAIGVQRMARRHAIVRRLPAVEALGEVDVICTDKTGTLTANEMTVRSVIMADGRIDVTGVGYHVRGELRPSGPGTIGTRELLMAAVNCGDAVLEPGDDGFAVNGDPTEAALLVLALKAGVALESARLSRIDVVPFESEQRFMATLHEGADGVPVLYAKGAPEVILARCSDALTERGQQPLDRAEWLTAVAALAARGERVIALARRSLPAARRIDGSALEGDLTLLGVVGVLDPPRAEVPEAIARCRSAGITVKMITGDHAETAAAIGRELGLADHDAVVTGEVLDDLPDERMAEVARRTAVFARTSPQHKLRLVEAMQADDHIVAMTGDGVNDAPALKRADVGVAMGRKGTQAAREAAAIVLADDNFATIVAAVEAGRTVYDNIRKSVVFLLPTSVAEASVIALAIVFGYALPMTPVQILWVNMITAVTLGIALAFEPVNPAAMARPPRVAREPLLSRLVVWRTVFVALLMVGGIAWIFSVEAASAGTDYARTAAVTALVVFEAVYLLSSRHLYDASYDRAGASGNRAVVLSILAVLVLQALFTYAPPLQGLFASQPLEARSWLLAALLAGGLFVSVELEKLVRRAVARRGPHGADGQRPPASAC